MKQEIKTPVLIVIAVLVLAGVGYFIMQSVGNAGNLDHGQVKYNPGVPPFLEKDPTKRGPGGSTPNAQPGAPPAPGT